MRRVPGFCIVDMQGDEGEKARAKIEKAGGGREALFAVCDVSDPEAVRGAVEQTVAKFVRLDVVFANAGINGVWTPIEELLPNAWRKPAWILSS